MRQRHGYISADRSKARCRHGETPSTRPFQRRGAVTEKPRRPDRSKGAVPSRRNPVDQTVPKARCRHGETPSTRPFQRRGAVTEKPRRPDRSISWCVTISRLCRRNEASALVCTVRSCQQCTLAQDHVTRGRSTEESCG